MKWLNQVRKRTMRGMRTLFFALGLGLGFVASAQAFTLTVFHVNDTHSRLEPAMVNRKPYGGMARLVTLARNIRSKERNVLFLHAGDAFQGTLYYNVYKGSADLALLNLIRPDAMALGNHEFDDGPEGLLPSAQRAQFPLLCANIDFSQEPELAKHVKPWTTMRFGRDEVAVIGVMTPDLPNIANPGPRLRMLDLDTSIEKAIREVKAKKLNKIVLLSHLGYDLDQEVAKKHPELDIIVGGHSHSFLGDLKLEGFPAPMGPYPTQVGRTLIVQAWEWAKIAGLLQVEFDRSGTIRRVLKKQTIPVDESIQPDPVVESVIHAFQKPILQLQQAVIGQSQSGVTRDGNESPMGNLIADAQLAATAKQGTVIALMNRGGIRAGLEPGTVTYGGIISVQPFNNTLVVLDVTGAEIDATLETAANGGRFMQVSKGFSYTINASNPEGQRVEATFEGKPLDPTKTYRVVVNSFMAKGGDGFTALRDARGYRLDTGVLDVDALIEFVRKLPTIEARAEGRVRVQP